MPPASLHLSAYVLTRLIFVTNCRILGGVLLIGVDSHHLFIFLFCLFNLLFHTVADGFTVNEISR